MKANKILLVSPPQHRAGLLSSLEGKDFQIHLASNFREAMQRLGGEHSYDVLVADAELPDGSWRDLLQFLQDARLACEMVVCSRCGDERLWAEVLECGAYDLLVEPYDPQEVRRIIERAIESQSMHRFHELVAS